MTFIPTPSSLDDPNFLMALAGMPTQQMGLAPLGATGVGPLGTPLAPDMMTPAPPVGGAPEPDPNSDMFTIMRALQGLMSSPSGGVQQLRPGVNVVGGGSPNTMGAASSLLSLSRL